MSPATFLVLLVPLPLPATLVVVPQGEIVYVETLARDRLKIHDIIVSDALVAEVNADRPQVRGKGPGWVVMTLSGKDYKKHFLIVVPSSRPKN